MDIRNHGVPFGGGGGGNGFGTWEDFMATSTVPIKKGDWISFGRVGDIPSNAVLDKTAQYSSNYGQFFRECRIELGENKYLLISANISTIKTIIIDLIQLGDDNSITILDTKVAVTTAIDVHSISKLTKNKYFLNYCLRSTDTTGSMYSMIITVDENTILMSTPSKTHVDALQTTGSQSSKDGGLILRDGERTGLLYTVYGGNISGYTDTAGVAVRVITFNEDYTEFTFGSNAINIDNKTLGSYAYVNDAFQWEDDEYVLLVNGYAYSVKVADSTPKLYSKVSLLSNISVKGVFIFTGGGQRVIAFGASIYRFYNRNNSWVLEEIAKSADFVDNSYSSVNFTFSNQIIYRIGDYDAKNDNTSYFREVSDGAYLLTPRLLWNSSYYLSYAIISFAPYSSELAHIRKFGELLANDADSTMSFYNKENNRLTFIRSPNSGKYPQINTYILSCTIENTCYSTISRSNFKGIATSNADVGQQTKVKVLLLPK